MTRPWKQLALAAAAATFACLAAGMAQAQASPLCAGQGSLPTISQPMIYGRAPGAIPQDAGFDCVMWQSFVYLNWPAKAGQRGVPDAAAAFGGAGPTVWESFRSVDETFLPNGQDPGPWNNAVAARAGVTPALRGQLARGTVRILNQTSKVSSALQSRGLPQLSSDQQAGGGVLVDQTGQPVYYEVRLNQAEYDYITGACLYRAAPQYAVASTTGLSLPFGAAGAGTPGAIEIKAAWKVLSPAELAARPVRFHTARALLGNSTTPVTVGLVGLHIAQRLAGMDQLVWATFSQIDNAPPIGAPPPSGAFSFYNRSCLTCGVNQPSAPNPTQVMQTSAPSKAAQGVNAAMQAQIARADASSPWQFYGLVDVQWPTAAVRLPSPAQPSGPGSPPIGSPNRTTLLNPVLETFMQGRTLSCLGCHQGAVAANPQRAANYPSSYSFVFAHASSATGACPGSRPRALRTR